MKSIIFHRKTRLMKLFCIESLNASVRSSMQFLNSLHILQLKNLKTISKVQSVVHSLFQITNIHLNNTTDPSRSLFFMQNGT